MDCSTPGLPVPHHLLEFTQIHMHYISDAIQPTQPLLPSSPFAFSLSQHQILPKSSNCISVCQWHFKHHWASKYDLSGRAAWTGPTCRWRNRIKVPTCCVPKVSVNVSLQDGILNGKAIWFGVWLFRTLLGKLTSRQQPMKFYHGNQLLVLLGNGIT